MKSVIENKNVDIKIEKSDLRSYHINSDKIKNILDYKPKEMLNLQLMN